MKILISLVLSVAFNQIQAYIWVQMNSSKSFPQNCGVGGNEKGETYTGPLYITRKQIGSEMVIGKISEGAKIAYLPTEGKEVAFDTFEILCGSPKQWDDKFNKNRNVAGGKSATGENFYVCQADDGTSKTPGTYKESTASCCIPYYGKEFCHKDKIVFLVNDC